MYLPGQMRLLFIIKNMRISFGGVNDTTHEIVGTTFNQYCEYNKEPYQNYLARNLPPSINFSFEETEIYGKRVVGLVIPAATEIPMVFKEKRFLYLIIRLFVRLS